ncbi:hypothetical protein ACEQ8H_007833 [Pleosporales sp. CAS-2024a]
MATSDVDGDVLANQLSLVSAKGQKLLASWLGPIPDAHSSRDAPKDDDKHAELTHDFSGHDRLGVGGLPPTDIADGSFTRRTITSDDKLLQQLLGKKKAKAHLAAKQEAQRRGAASQPQPRRKDVVKQEESEEEDEGRAAAFTSKRRKIVTPSPSRAKPTSYLDQVLASRSQKKRNRVNAKGVSET